MLVMIAVAILGGYIVSSLVLFKFPYLLHKPKRLKFSCKHISHRGGAGENLENTLAAYQHAVSMGTEMLEIDLQLTKDGHVVVSHDSNLTRITGENINVWDLNYCDLPKLKEILPVDFDRGQVCYGKGDRQIPLLKDVYEKYPDVVINIDIKVDNDLLISKVSELTKQYRREELTVWGNSSNKITVKCYKENPTIPILFSAKRVIWLVIMMYTGLLPFVPLKESCLEVPFPQAIKRLTRDATRRQRFLFWLLDSMLIRKYLFEHLQKRGIPTYVWVLNEEKDFEDAFNVGAEGIMTDYPSRLRNYLDKKSAIS